MPNAIWDKYVVVTTHYDQLPRLVGWSEDCEDYMCSIAETNLGWTVYRDFLWFSNRDWLGRRDGAQYCMMAGHLKLGI